ncbi:hypothetical protein MKZ17_07805 [Solibacillus sp. FSL R7-0682]|uniref:hypothetical protein n=1 Tax=Solibacillus sp. FSL R7-0682 TaxID=2921690 RepID=UPI0030FCDE52
MNKKQNTKLIIIVFTTVLIILTIPGILANFLKFSIFEFAPGKVDAWIGFWGSYLGGIVGMIAVVITTFFLIGNQNKQHYELLTEQKNSIDNSAELNDKKTREREHKLFLININEELVQSLIQITKLIKLRIEVFRKINNIGQEKLNLTRQQEFYKNNKIVHGKEDLIHETTLTLMMDRKASQFRESELLAEIEIEIAKIRILYARLDLETNEIESLNSLINENKNNMIDIINKDGFGEEYTQIITKFNQEVMEILNGVSVKHIDNIKELFEAYKK